MDKPICICCVPVDPKLQRGIPYNPPNLHEFSKTQCEICNVEVYLGPVSVVKRKETGLPVWCPVCALEVMQETANRIGEEITPTIIRLT